jgi:dynein assembly factor 1
VETFESDELKTTSFSVSVPFDIQKDSINVQVLSHESPVVDEAAEVAYEGEDEQEENVSLKRDLSNFDLQSHATNSGEASFPRNVKLDSSHPLDTMGNEQYAKKAEKKVDEKGIDVIQSGHVSDPGIGKAEFWGSPKLKRSCSNLETSRVLRKIVAQFPLTFQYSEELQGLAEKVRDPSSPTSVISRRSADRVMLKKHSSSQVLPSRSRRLWWKLFLWSHRNLHKPWFVKPLQPAVSKLLSQQGGYSSDTLEPNRAMSKMQSPGSFTVKSMDKGHNNNEEDSQSWNSFHAGISGLWPQDQWVAFSVESSPFSRVNEWVKDLETHPSPLDAYDNNNDVRGDDDIVFPPSPDTGRSPRRAMTRPDFNLSVEMLHANSVIQSLNSSSTVAHISGNGLKAIPTTSRFSSLRSVNLSNNFIGMLLAEEKCQLLKEHTGDN